MAVGASASRLKYCRIKDTMTMTEGRQEGSTPEDHPAGGHEPPRSRDGWMDGNLFEELSWYTNSSELYGTQRARLLNQEQLTTGRTHETHNTVKNYSSSSNWSIGTKQER